MTEPWVKTYSGGKPNYTEPCERCGEVNPAEIHTCTLKQREWVGLTDDEVDDVGCDFATLGGDIESKNWFAFYLAIEAKLKEKNG
jgi:hypothetical protein